MYVEVEKEGVVVNKQVVWVVEYMLAIEIALDVLIYICVFLILTRVMTMYKHFKKCATLDT